MATEQTIKCDVTEALTMYTLVFSPFRKLACISSTLQTVLVDLQVDDRDVVDAVVDTTDNGINQDTSSSNVAILRQSQGQTVWLKAYPTKRYTAELTSADTFRDVSFSGVFLYV